MDSKLAVAEAESYLAQHDLQAIIARAVNACYAARANNPQKFLVFESCLSPCTLPFFLSLLTLHANLLYLDPIIE